MDSPTGWDNEKKIAILYENIQSVSPDDNYNDVIIRPVSSKVSHSLFIRC
jgi:dynein light intermediate chain 1